MKNIYEFLLNITLISLGVILKDIFQIDEFLFFIIVFWLYLITNTFINKIQLNEEYILILLFVSIIYTFATYQLSVVVYQTIMQLICGSFIGEINDYFPKESEFKKNPFKRRISSYDLIQKGLM